MVNEFRPSVFSMSSSRSSPKFSQTGFVPIPTSFWTKSNRPSLSVNTFLVVWLVLIKFPRLHIISILRRSSLSLSLERLLIPLVKTYSLSYYWQEGLGNAELARLKLVCSLRHHPSFLMGSQPTTFNVGMVLGKETCSPLPLPSCCQHSYTNPLSSRQ